MPYPPSLTRPSPALVVASFFCLPQRWLFPWLLSLTFLSLHSHPQESHLTSCDFNWPFSVDSSQSISSSSSLYLKLQTHTPVFLQDISLYLFPWAQTELTSLPNLFFKPSSLFPLLVENSHPYLESQPIMSPLLCAPPSHAGHHQDPFILPLPCFYLCLILRENFLHKSNTDHGRSLVVQTCIKQKIHSSRRNTPKLILQGHHHPDTKTRQRHHKKRKLQANITDEHRHKNPQQNTSKRNPATH